MSKYRKKPVVTRVFQYDGDLMNRDGKYYVPGWAAEAFEDGRLYYRELDGNPAELFVKTPDGDRHASVGDFILRDVDGEFHSCKPDVFAATYEAVEEEAITSWNQRVSNVELEKLYAWRDGVRLRIANELENLVNDDDPEEVQNKADEAYQLAGRFLFEEAEEWGEDQTRCGQQDKAVELIRDVWEDVREMAQKALEAVADTDADSPGNELACVCVLYEHKDLLRRLAGEGNR